MNNFTIAICDILGFTNLVQQNPLESVVELSLGWLKRSLYHSLFRGEFPSETPTFEQLLENKEVGVEWFSDTILLYTREDDNTCLQSLISTVSWLLFETMFTQDVRIRCGISYGEAFIDPSESIYVGKPIIEAYHLEEKQAWSGGALTAAASDRVPPKFRSGEPPTWPLTIYNVPFNDKTTFETSAINWTFGIHPNLKIQWSNRFEEPTNQDWNDQTKVSEKWQNTKMFHDQVCTFCRPRT